MISCVCVVYVLRVLSYLSALDYINKLRNVSSYISVNLNVEKEGITLLTK